ncbi:MAG: hypothetical protein U1F57_07240 [bacterium]
MSLIHKIQEGLQTAETIGEKIIQNFAEEYEKNATPTDSFVQEVRHLQGVKALGSSAAKSHPLFPLTRLQKEIDSTDSKGAMKKAAFELGRLRQKVEKEEGASAAIPLLMLETRLALMRGDTVTADLLSARLMAKSREAAAAKALLPVQALVAKGELTPSDLKDHKPYLAIVTIDGGKALAATPFFLKLSPPEQLAILKDVSRLGLIAEHRSLGRTALLAYDEPRRLYHESQIALLQGNTAKARVLMMDLKEKTVSSQEPEIVLMREEAREILRTFSLSEMDSLIAFNESVVAQQKGNRYGWNIREQLSGDSRNLSFKRMRTFLEKGQADTLEEAYALARKKGLLGKIDGVMAPLFKMGTYEGLQRLAHPEDKKRYLLEIVDAINHRDGSYAVAGKMLEDVFQDELRRELSACSEEKREAIRAEVDVKKIEKEVKQMGDVFETALDGKLAAWKEKDPQPFTARFGEAGPSADERAGLLREMAASEVKHRVTLKIGYRLLAESHESGELAGRDAYADKAWTIYNDTFDPLDEIFNVAHATSDALKKEALFTAVSLPAGLGAGVLARSTIGGTSLVVRMAAQGGLRAVAAEGMIVGAGALAEGLTGVSLNALLKGEKITAGSAGMEFLSSFVSGSVGRLWSRGAKALKLDEAGLQKIATEGGSRAEILGRKIAGFAAPLTLSVTQATVFGEIGILFEDEAAKTTFAERFVGNMVKALVNPQLEKGIHHLTGGRLEKMEETTWKRLQVARDVFLVKNELPMTESNRVATALTKAGWTEKQVLEFLSLDPSLAPLVMPSSEKAEDLVKNLSAGGVKDQDSPLEVNPF